MEAPTITTPAVEGQVSTPETPQATLTPEQSGSTPQPTTTVPVENGSQPTTEETPKASDFENARQIKRLVKEMQSLKQIIENNSRSAPTQSVPQASPPPNITQQDLLNNPLGTIQKMIDLRQEQIMGLVNQTVSQRDMEMRHQRSVEEGWKIIGSSNTYKNDPEGMDRMKEILSEKDESGGSLQDYSVQNPIHAAKLALAEYEQRYGKRSPAANAPQKAQMVSTATASYPGGSKLNINEEALKLQQEAYTNPDVMKDPTWKARLTEITKQYNQQKMLAQE